MPVVLIIAPDEGLRRSIAFALEVEGHSVMTSYSVLALLDERNPIRFACAVVDEEALVSDPMVLERMAAPPVPVVLLVDRSQSHHRSFPSIILHKPLLGERLVNAVAEAVGPTVSPPGPDRLSRNP